MDYSSFANWWKQPFNAQASAWTWILFTGFILVTIWLWVHILREGGHVVEKVVTEAV